MSFVSATALNRGHLTVDLNRDCSAAALFVLLSRSLDLLAPYELLCIFLTSYRLYVVSALCMVVS